MIDKWRCVTESEHVWLPQTQSTGSSTGIKGEACPTGLDSSLGGNVASVYVHWILFNQGNMSALTELQCNVSNPYIINRHFWLNGLLCVVPIIWFCFKERLFSLWPIKCTSRSLWIIISYDRAARGLGCCVTLGNKQHASVCGINVQ